MPFPSSLFYATCSIILTTYFLLKAWTTSRKEAQAARLHGCKPIPKVRSLDPVIGIDNFFKILKADLAGHRSEAYRNLHNEYGPTFLFRMLGVTSVQTAQPLNIQAICTSAFQDFGVGPLRGTIGLPFFGRGIFTEDGEFWKYSRSLVRPTFSRAEIADLDNFENHVQRFLAHIPRDGSTFDMLPLAKRLFLDTATDFMFGESTECLSSSAPLETDIFLKAFDRSLLGLALLLTFGPLRWPLYFDPYWRKAYTKVHDFLDKHVHRAIERQKDPIEVNSHRYVLLEEMAKITQDPYQLRMQILNVFFPARDTSAVAFADLMFQLVRHPHEWQKVKTEVRNIDPNQKLTYEYLRSLKVVKAVINEALRLHPAASRITRIALRDVVLPKGGGDDGQSPFLVHKGTVVEMDLYTVQRDPSIWGEDADEFKPNRWLDPGRPLWEAKWQYEPFLGGIRMCPAQNQVLIQLSYILVRLAQEVEVLETRDEVWDYIERVSLVVESKNGVKMAVKCGDSTVDDL
ncbi:putative cytochrome P450 52A12 protein [Rutstroemia sp. NJR-2017a WRK4]|nr:putative cytochrome P450 52A12 protein [Rutstroemia sp. NJR-2017a WRK4]